MPERSRGNRRRNSATEKHPSIFISATTRDLRAARDHISRLVVKNGFFPVVEESFETIPNNVNLARFLNLKLRECVGVIHLAGLHYGGEVRHPGRSSKRMSWTQMEYCQAKLLRKPVLVGLAKSRRRYKESGSTSEQRAKGRLQTKHYERLQNGSGVYYDFDDPADLDIEICGFLKQFKVAPAKQAVKVLFVGAQSGTGLALRKQFRQIRSQVARRSAIRLEGVFDCTALEIIAEINKRQPTIVHLSGSQRGGSIMLHNGKGALVPFDADQLASALAQTNSQSLKLIVLDTCYSMHQAQQLTRRGVPYAIGIYDAIADDVATEFYSAFYNQLASGSDLGTARDSARSLLVGGLKKNPGARRELETEVLEMKFDPAIHVPALSHAKGLDPRVETFL